jgi:hypothetical protein
VPIVVLVLALVAYAYALLAYPEFRRPGLIGGALVGIVLGIYFWQQTPEATRAASRIVPEEIELDHLDLERTARGATLTGRVRNGSERFRLRDVTLVVRLYDCAEAAAPPDCPVIGEAQAIARPDVPPGQLRAFSAHLLFADLPPLAGTLRWDWRIAATRGTE